jgi:LmbE family N-acetylglucosaminyl deacetylase
MDVREAPPAPSEVASTREAAGTRAAVVVAHPDDEVLWCGGFILSHPTWSWHVVTLCRGDDPDRAPRFRRALARLGATGAMGNLEDGPAQQPLPRNMLERALVTLLPPRSFDLLLTHGPRGEYTRHRRHEECSRVVARLCRQRRIEAGEVWLFAYEDGGRKYLPRVHEAAEIRYRLSLACWRAKRTILRDIYGFLPDSWEVRAAPREEGFIRLRANEPRKSLHSAAGGR